MALRKLKKLTAHIMAQPEDLYEEGSVMVFESNRAVQVSACRSLLGYSEKEVRLRLTDGTLTITGSTLTLRGFNGDQMEIRGNISGMLFEGDIRR